jgi:hypothetical protein
MAVNPWESCQQIEIGSQNEGMADLTDGKRALDKSVPLVIIGLRVMSLTATVTR